VHILCIYILCFTYRSSLHKRSRDEVATAMECINKQNIIIERTVLRSDIRVAPFNFIYQVFQENGWLSLFEAINIYPRLVHEFDRNLKIDNIYQLAPCLDTKVRGTSLRIDADLISSITGIPVIDASSTPFPDSVAPPSMEVLMRCFNPHWVCVWEEGKNSIPIG
jgi:hypothetical protein